SKRASMREGPLAALFRKTDEEQPEAKAKPTPAPAPEPVREEPQARREVPHPALRPQPRPAVDEPHIPTPQERLRHAFSADIPENVLEAPPLRLATPARVPFACYEELL